VDNNSIASLPLNTRKPFALLELVPGYSGSIGNNYNDVSYSEMVETTSTAIFLWMALRRDFQPSTDIKALAFFLPWKPSANFA
jgi:hypothetical protein